MNSATILLHIESAQLRQEQQPDKELPVQTNHGEVLSTACSTCSVNKMWLFGAKMQNPQATAVMYSVNWSQADVAYHSRLLPDPFLT